MRPGLESWLFVVFATLLVCSSARPHALEKASLKTDVESNIEVTSRSAFSFLGLEHLFPRVAIFQPALKPALAPALKPAPEPPKQQPPPKPAALAETPKIAAPAKSPASLSSKSASTSPRTSASSATPSPSSIKKANKKCSYVGCGTGPGSCATTQQLLAGRSEDEIDSQLEKRAYQDVNTLLDTKGSTNLNVDLTDPEDDGSAATGFITFTPGRRRSVRAKGLAGCTIVAAFSPKGMIVNHLFEMGDHIINEGKANSQKLPLLENTLHPAAVEQTLAHAALAFAEAKDQLEGGQLHIMIPINSEKSPTDAGKFRYDTETWAGVSADGKTFLGDPDDANDPRRVGRSTLSSELRDAFETATGLQAVIHNYEVSNDDDIDDPAVLPGHGTFVLQFDPNNNPSTPEPQGVQMFIETQPVLNPADPEHGFNFALISR